MRKLYYLIEFFFPFRDILIGLRSTIRVHESVDDFDAVEIWCRDERSAIVKLHQVADLLLLRILCFLSIEGTLQIHHVVGMGCTTTITLSIDGGIGLLGEAHRI